MGDLHRRIAFLEAAAEELRHERDEARRAARELWSTHLDLYVFPEQWVGKYPFLAETPGKGCDG